MKESTPRPISEPTVIHLRAGAILRVAIHLQGAAAATPATSQLPRRAAVAIRPHPAVAEAAVPIRHPRGAVAAAGAIQLLHGAVHPAAGREVEAVAGVAVVKLNW